MSSFESHFHHTSQQHFLHSNSGSSLFITTFEEAATRLEASSSRYAFLGMLRSGFLTCSCHSIPSGTILSRTVSAVAQFDAQLFVAHCCDWHDLVLEISESNCVLPWVVDSFFCSDQIVSTEECVRANSALKAARSSIIKARNQYERALQQYSSTLGRHREVTQQVEQLKERLAEVSTHCFTAA